MTAASDSQIGLKAPATPRRWRPTLILAAVMLGWLFVIMIVSGAVGQTAKLPAGVPLTVSHGVTIRLPSGWASATKQWNVGPGGISMRKGGVIVAIAADVYAGFPQQLLDDQLGQVKTQFSYFQSLPPDNVAVAGNLTGRRELFNGTQNGSSLDGELVAVSARGTGVALLAIAPSGQLSSIQGDLNEMLAGMRIP